MISGLRRRTASSFGALGFFRSLNNKNKDYWSYEATSVACFGSYVSKASKLWSVGFRLVAYTVQGFVWGRP